jgi:hypothetical protein
LTGWLKFGNPRTPAATERIETRDDESKVGKQRGKDKTKVRDEDLKKG